MGKKGKRGSQLSKAGSEMGKAGGPARASVLTRARKIEIARMGGKAASHSAIRTAKKAK